MLVWQTFPPVLKFAFGYSLMMDTLAGVGVGGIHISEQLEKCAHTHTHTHNRWSVVHHSIHDPACSIHKSFTFTVRSNSFQRLTCLFIKWYWWIVRPSIKGWSQLFDWLNLLIHVHNIKHKHTYCSRRTKHENLIDQTDVLHVFIPPKHTAFLLYKSFNLNENMGCFLPCMSVI